MSISETVGEERKVNLPILSDLFGEIPYGRVILTLYDPEGQYSAFLINVSAGHLKSGGDLLYLASARPTNEIRNQFNRLGVRVEDYEAKDKAVIFDAYSAQMGVKSQEKYQASAMNLNDLSILISQSAPQWPAGTLVVAESFSNMAFNQENVFAKFSRKAAGIWRTQGAIMLVGLALDLHPPEFYQEMKLVSDGVYEIRRMEYGEEIIDTIRGRSLKGSNMDTRIRRIIFDNTMKASLQPLKPIRPPR